MRAKKLTSIRLDKESVGKILEMHLESKGFKVRTLSFDMIDVHEDGQKFLGVTATFEEEVEI